MVKNKDYTMHTLITLIISICATIIIVVGMVKTFEANDFKIKGNLECSSGDIDLKYTSDFQYNPLSKDTLEQLYLPRLFEVYGIDNVNCKANYEIEANTLALTKLLI